MRVMVTGAAGFIGFHLSRTLLDRGDDVVGLDNLNDYYDVNLKYARLAETGIYSPEETRHEGGENREYAPIEMFTLLETYRIQDLRRPRKKSHWIKYFPPGPSSHRSSN